MIKFIRELKIRFYVLVISKKIKKLDHAFSIKGLKIKFKTNMVADASIKYEKNGPNLYFNETILNINHKSLRTLSHELLHYGIMGSMKTEYLIHYTDGCCQKNKDCTCLKESPMHLRLALYCFLRRMPLEIKNRASFYGEYYDKPSFDHFEESLVNYVNMKLWKDSPYEFQKITNNQVIFPEDSPEYILFNYSNKEMPNINKVIKKILTYKWN